MKLAVDKGMFFFLIKKLRPKLANYISKEGKVETIIVGLGSEATKHALLMKEYGTLIVAAVAPGRGNSYIHESIPVYDNIKECLSNHPNIAAASIWRHYSSARDATIEVIESGIPIIVLITEGIPLRDMRDIIFFAKKHNTLLFGGNTPGIIFPPEGIKIGMLPDIFYPAEPEPGVFGPDGVSIISRSGAILYHLSDALASCGIAQNAVLGIGGDAAVGTTFKDIVPLVSEYEHTDLVVIAGEIGGYQEELLAEDILKNPNKYQKPIIAFISGSHAPEGKTMGHAGAIIVPGENYGTFESKKKAFEKVGIPVVNSQYDLIKEVKSKLKGKTYFEITRYYESMEKKWNAPPKPEKWTTFITDVKPNSIIISGYSLTDLIKNSSFLETVYLLLVGKLPDKKILQKLNEKAIEGVLLPISMKINMDEDIAKFLAKCIMNDPYIPKLPIKTKEDRINKTTFTLGRVARYLFKVFSKKYIAPSSKKEPFTYTIFRALTGKDKVDQAYAKMIEKMIIASVDHGVTPPSTQATIISASVRAPYEVAIAAGIGAITDIHGGAGAEAAKFFKKCVELARANKDIDKRKSTRLVIEEYVSSGKRIEGLGHRIHTHDPRCEVLWQIAKEINIAKDCVEISKFVSEIFTRVRGITLPINVDGVIGAIVADMNLSPSVAKAVFIYGRIAGLSAHYFEEITYHQPMRRINFSDAVYKPIPAKT